MEADFKVHLMCSGTMHLVQQMVTAVHLRKAI